MKGTYMVYNFYDTWLMLCGWETSVRKEYSTSSWLLEA